MAEKARSKLFELQQKWWSPKTTSVVSPEQVIRVFQNTEKFTQEKQNSILATLIKPHVTNYNDIRKQYDSDTQKHKKTPYEAFVKLVNNAVFVPVAGQKPQVPVKPTKHDFDSPTLSSTRVENKRRSDVNVSEIKERLALATQISTNTQSATFLRPSLNSSSSSSKSLRTVSYTPKDAISSWNFSFDDSTIMPPQMKFPKPIVGLPVSAQERTIITELLNTLIGINGTLIVPKIRYIMYDDEDFTRNSGSTHCKISIVEFELNEQIQDSIRDILNDILPLANHYFQIQNFVDYSATPESGQVLQALSNAVGKILTDYYGTIAQLEGMHVKQELNLQKIIFYLRPIIQTMENVTKVCNMLLANNVRGGNVLTSLHDNIGLFSGERNSQQILIFLTQKAAEPYMEILKLWLFKGVIIDRKNEFFVEDNERDCNPDQNENYFNEFWDKRYVLRSDKIPRFLEKQADMILKTGKYLNVVRECGKRVVSNHAQGNLKFSHTDEQNYVNIITDAYTFASKALLELVMDDNDLMGHLLSVKRYFLLQQGDFIVQFMDACESEMMKSVDEIVPMRLENLLELTLRLSSAKHDKYQDNLYTTFFAFDICTQMSKIINPGDDMVDGEDSIDYYSLRCIEYFVFGYNVQWPLSIVLNQLTMSKYQLIFRQLFYCKYVENYLCRVWIENKNAKKFDQKTSEQYRAAFTLRQRMLTAIQNLEYYMMVEVIEPVWHIFMQQMAKAKNIDDVLNFHEDFLDHCLKNCMLQHTDLLKRIVAVAKDCISFCEFIEEAQRHFIDAELSSMMSSNYIQDECKKKQSPSAMNDSDLKNLTFSETVAKFDSNFTSNIVRLLDAVYEIAERDSTEKFISLCNRLNFNNYYSKLLSARR